MFLTTVRVRRARPATLDKFLTGSAFKDARESKTIAEVMAHGDVVAIVDVANRNRNDGVIWHAEHVSASHVSAVARNAVAVMRDVEPHVGTPARDPATV